MRKPQPNVRRPVNQRRLALEQLEQREMNAVLPNSPAIIAQLALDQNIPNVTETEAQVLLARAAAASNSEDAIIAVVDRGGKILGVRMEQDVLDHITDEAIRVFAIDGAVSKARTAAFFANDQAPLTSRTIRNLSQSTITQREVEANPNVPDPLVNNPFNDADPTARTYGPGFVAPIGDGGHFPQGITNAPPVDLFGIEHQSRDSIIHPGLDGVKGSADDIVLASRFNVDTAFIPAGKEIDAPESYGYQSDRLPYAQSRGIATLPGGIPLFKVIGGKPILVGGIGVFFPGDDGYATFEQNFVQAPTETAKPQTNEERLNAPKVLEAEWMAFAAAGGATGLKTLKGQSVKVGAINGVPALPNYDMQAIPGRIDLAGITLEVVGPNPTAKNKLPGVETIQRVGNIVSAGGDGTSGDDQIVLPGGDLYLNGETVPSGWLVMPHASPSGSSTLTAADVQKIIDQGIAEANKTRAAIRLDLTGKTAKAGQRTQMVFAVADRDGNVLGLYRMPDATVFSIDVAVAKARNTAYYADASAIQPADLVDDDILLARGSITAADLTKNKAKTNGIVGVADLYKDKLSKSQAVPLTGNAFSNRTFRFLAEPRYPAGINSPPPIFSSLNEVEIASGVNKTRINPKTAENIGQPMLASQFQTVYGYDAFHAGRNLHDIDNIANQNGTVFFPGSSPLYVGANLQGGFGVSGDGVDQDDVVTFYGQVGYAPPTALKADQVFYREVRLPFQKFNRTPLR
ncbi:heme-binding protein [Anatilimnocola floriformis]|uniref:heme-binding protein n=1 Tax=Anatilimnocola floriformis TaxID=2948575 RepID=UPI0020C4A852|nr:heme-binding protein [Anatilimnocola floriformis]